MNVKGNVSVAETVIETKALKKYYKGEVIKALDGVDLTIYRGEVVVIIGPSGSGKSKIASRVLQKTDKFEKLISYTTDASVGLPWGSLIALVISFAYLLARRVITWHTPAAFVGTVFLFSLLMEGFDAMSALALVLSGGLLIGAIFMATDYVTSPVTKRGQIIYGVGCGVLTVLFRYYGLFPEGVTYAILLMNLCVWTIDRYTAPRIYGHRKGGASNA